MNTPPVILAINPVTVTSRTFTDDLSTYVTDVDNDPLTYQQAEVATTCENVTITTDGQVTATIPEALVDKCSIQFTASDGVNTAVPGSVEYLLLVVESPSPSPEVNPPPFTTPAVETTFPLGSSRYQGDLNDYVGNLPVGEGLTFNPGPTGDCGSNLFTRDGAFDATIPEGASSCVITYIVSDGVNDPVFGSVTIVRSALP